MAKGKVIECIGLEVATSAETREILDLRRADRTNSR